MSVEKRLKERLNANGNGITSPPSLDSTGGSEVFGLGAAAGETENVAVGNGAHAGTGLAGSLNCTAAGQNAAAGDNVGLIITDATAVGHSADANEVEATAVGASSAVTGARGTALGKSASVTGADGIAIGKGAVATANMCYVGPAVAEFKVVNSGGIDPIRAVAAPGGNNRTGLFLVIQQNGGTTAVQQVMLGPIAGAPGAGTSALVVNNV